MTDYRALARDVLAPDIDYSTQQPLHFSCESNVRNCLGHIVGFHKGSVIIRGIAQDASYHFVRHSSGTTKRHTSLQAAMDAAELGENAEAPKPFKAEERGTQGFNTGEQNRNALVGGEHLSHAGLTREEVNEETDEDNDGELEGGEDAGLPDKHEAKQYAGEEFDAIPAAKKPNDRGTSGYGADMTSGAPSGFHSASSHASRDSGVDRNALAGFLKDCGLDNAAIQKACDVACGQGSDTENGGVMSGTSSGMPTGGGMNTDPGTAGYQMDEFDRIGGFDTEGATGGGSFGRRF